MLPRKFVQCMKKMPYRYIKNATALGGRLVLLVWMENTKSLYLSDFINYFVFDGTQAVLRQIVAYNLLQLSLH